MKNSIRTKGLGLLLALVLALGCFSAASFAFAEDRADGNVSLTFESAADLNELKEDAADANANGAAAVENGKLKLSKAKGWGQYALRFGFSHMQKFTATMDVSLDVATLDVDNEATEDVSLGFAARLKGGTSWTATSLHGDMSAAKPRSYMVNLTRRGDGDPAYQPYDSYISNADYSAVTFTMIGDGTSIRLYLNGAKVAENVKEGVGETTLNEGDIAILLYGTAGATFYIDNVTVKNAVVEPGTEHDRADGNVSLIFESAADLGELYENAADANSNGAAAVEEGKLKLTKEYGWGQYALRFGYLNMKSFTASMEVSLDPASLVVENANAEDVSIGFATRLSKTAAWTAKGIDSELSAAKTRPYMVNLIRRGDGEPAYAEYDRFASSADYAKVTFTVIGDDTSVKAYLNGVKVAENVKDGVSATTLNEGDIAILLYGTAGATFYIDNVTVKNEIDEPKEELPSYELQESFVKKFDTDTDTSFLQKNALDGGAAGSAVVADKELCLSFEKSGDAQFAAWRVGNAGEKFTLTMNVAMDKGLFGVFVRTAQDKNWQQQGVMMQDNVDAGGSLSLVKYPEGKIFGGDGEDGNVVYLGDAVKQYIQVKIIGDGKKITVLIGNEYSKTLENKADGAIDESTPLTGEIGFLLYNPTGDAAVYFDYLELKSEADYTAPEILGKEDPDDDKKDDDNKGDDDKKDEENKGCGGMVSAATLFGAAGILGAACIVLFRKKQ